MRQPVCSIILVVVLLFPAAAHSQSAAVDSVAGQYSGASDDPMAEQATMALVLGGLAAVLKRYRSGRR